MTIDTLRQMIKSNACEATTDICSHLSVRLKKYRKVDFQKEWENYKKGS